MENAIVAPITMPKATGCCSKGLGIFIPKNPDTILGIVITIVNDVSIFITLFTLLEISDET